MEVNILKKVYLAYKAEESKKFQFDLLKQGKWPFSAPIGYKFIRHGSRRRGHSELIVDEVKAPIIKRIFELYATNAYTLKTIKNMIKEEFDYTISDTHIYNIIDNPFYGGFLKSNKTKELFAHTYPLLIPDFIYKRAVEIWQDKHKINVKISRKHNYMFSGLLQCAECSCAITSDQHKGHIYYFCTQSKGKHNALRINEPHLAMILKDYLISFYKNNPDYKQEEWDNNNETHMRIIFSKIFKRLYLHSDKTISHELYSIEDKISVNKPIVSFQEESIKGQLSILLNKTWSIDELVEVLKADMGQIQQALIEMQLDGLIDQNESGLWTNL